MKARVEVRHLGTYCALHTMYDTVHLRRTVINRYTPIYGTTSTVASQRERSGKKEVCWERPNYNAT